MRMLKRTSAYVTLMMNFVTVIEKISAGSSARAAAYREIDIGVNAFGGICYAFRLEDSVPENWPGVTPNWSLKHLLK